MQVSDAVLITAASEAFRLARVLPALHSKGGLTHSRAMLPGAATKSVAHEVLPRLDPGRALLVVMRQLDQLRATGYPKGSREEACWGSVVVPVS
ncbi:protein of unknown function [Streptantibioticus cattleyicolor NRRL 8057 = DSM 46488]|nr:protein of unknown function [Streptantibioticus cattleyicolor NRRL 8057 = DSM 46488]